MAPFFACIWRGWNLFVLTFRQRTQVDDSYEYHGAGVPSDSYTAFTLRPPLSHEKHAYPVRNMRFP